MAVAFAVGLDLVSQLGPTLGVLVVVIVVNKLRARGTSPLSFPLRWIPPPQWAGWHLRRGTDGKGHGRMAALLGLGARFRGKMSLRQMSQAGMRLHASRFAEMSVMEGYVPRTWALGRPSPRQQQEQGHLV